MALPAGAHASARSAAAAAAAEAGLLEALLGSGRRGVLVVDPPHLHLPPQPLPRQHGCTPQCWWARSKHRARYRFADAAVI